MILIIKDLQVTPLNYEGRPYLELSTKEYMYLSKLTNTIEKVNKKLHNELLAIHSRQ